MWVVCCEDGSNGLVSFEQELGSSWMHLFDGAMAWSSSRMTFDLGECELAFAH